MEQDYFIFSDEKHHVLTGITVKGKKQAEIVIPDDVTEIGDYAFAGCSNLLVIKIPEGVTTIGKWAFKGCCNLGKIKFPESLTEIKKRAFYECKGLKYVNLSCQISKIGRWAFNGEYTSIMWSFYGVCKASKTKHCIRKRKKRIIKKYIQKKYLTYKENKKKTVRKKVTKRQLILANEYGLKNIDVKYNTEVFRVAYYLGTKGIDLSHAKTVSGFRYGKAPRYFISKNKRDNFFENGLSMAKINGEKEASGTTDWYCYDFPKYKYSGLLSGRGSDDEALILCYQAENFD